MTDTAPHLSLVIPAYNEAESIPELVKQIEAAIGERTYEIIFIDDGSTDGTDRVIQAESDRNGNIRYLNFKRNFGKSAALSEGFQRARGEIIITMDADLQDDPAEIDNLLAALDDGYDLVSGWKKKRHDPLNKRLPSKIFNYVTSKVAGFKLHDFNCGLKAYRNEVAKRIRVYGEMHRFLPVLAFWQGYKVGEIPVQHHARKYGYSKFGARRFFSGFFDLLTVLFITKYKRKPMHLFGLLGLLCLAVGSLILTYLLVIKLMGEGIGQRPLLILGVLTFIVGVQFIGIGLLGELFIHANLRNREYTITSEHGFDDH